MFSKKMDLPKNIDDSSIITKFTFIPRNFGLFGENHDFLGYFKKIDRIPSAEYNESGFTTVESPDPGFLRNGHNESSHG